MARHGAPPGVGPLSPAGFLGRYGAPPGGGGRPEAAALLLDLLGRAAAWTPHHAHGVRFPGPTGKDTGAGAEDGRAADSSGRTALMHAARRGSVGRVRALLRRHGGVAAAGVNLADHNGETALHKAVHSGSEACVRALLGADGVDANAANVAGLPPLLLATLVAPPGWRGCVRALVAARGVDVNYRSVHTGKTALHRACRLGDAGLVAELLLAGACRFALDNKGRAALPPTAQPALRCVFLAGIDYWHRQRHARHARALRNAVQAVMLARRRLDSGGGGGGGRPAVAESDAGSRAPAGLLRVAGHGGAGGGGAVAPVPLLPHLPEEIWLAVCGFLRGADFV